MLRGLPSMTSALDHECDMGGSKNSKFSWTSLMKAPLDKFELHRVYGNLILCTLEAPKFPGGRKLISLLSTKGRKGGKPAWIVPPSGYESGTDLTASSL